MTDLSNYTTVEFTPDALPPGEPPMDPVLRAAINELAPRLYAEVQPGRDWLGIGWEQRTAFRKWVKGWLEARAERDANEEYRRVVLPEAKP